MPKEFLLQTFPIDWFVKEAYIVVTFYANITGCVGITVYWYETCFILSLKENTVFVKLLETSYGMAYLCYLLNFRVKSSLTLWVLFEHKHF